MFIFEGKWRDIGKYLPRNECNDVNVDSLADTPGFLSKIFQASEEYYMQKVVLSQTLGYHQMIYQDFTVRRTHVPKHFPMIQFKAGVQRTADRAGWSVLFQMGSRLLGQISISCAGQISWFPM